MYLRFDDIGHRLDKLMLNMLTLPLDFKTKAGLRVKSEGEWRAVHEASSGNKTARDGEPNRSFCSDVQM